MHLLSLRPDEAVLCSICVGGPRLALVCCLVQVKVYLTASSAVRAKRRYQELAAKGESCDMDTIEADIIERDRQDMTREISPLVQAEDAVLVDSSDMTIEEVAARIMSLVKKQAE